MKHTNFFGITVKLKENTNKLLTYYYSTNRIEVNEKTAGIFTVHIDIFEELSEEWDPFYYSNHACKKVIEDKAIQIKFANDPLMLADGIDYHFVATVRELLVGYKETHIIPTSTYFISIDKLKKELNEFPNFVNSIPNDKKWEQKTLDSIINEYISRTVN